jgi:SET family sugar efflux transporter-like MFS transporter
LRLADSLDPFRIPAFSIAASAVFLAILAEAMAGSYMALLAVERAHMSPLELSAFLTLSAVSSIAVTALFGRWHDERPQLWPLVVCLVAGIVCYGLDAVVTDPLGLMAIAFMLLGFSNTAYPLLFAIAKRYVDAHGPATASRGMAALRMISSLSWAVGPAIGAVFVGIWSYEGVFFAAAAFALAALIAVFGGRLEPGAREAGDPIAIPVDWRTIWPAALALTLFNTAMFIGSNALSIVTVNSLNGSESDVGWLFSLCAALEVVVMGAYVVRPAKGATRPVLVIGFALFGAYFLICLLLPGLTTLYWAQIPRAVAIGIVSVIGMLYVQDAMPRQAGSAAALFSNTVNAGFLLSGAATGVWADAFGYWSLFGLCAALALIGAGLFAVSRFPRPEAVLQTDP